MAALLGFGLLAALAAASQLRADPRGWGTHEQLGLPGCTFLSVVGKRCPACGMTTAWAHLTQGRPADALRAHATGTLLAVAAVVVAVLALATAARGSWLAWLPGEKLISALALIGSGLILLEWIYRLSAP